MRICLTILIALIIVSCEDVVVIELPSEQNLIVVEGWITDTDEVQELKISRSNNFSGIINPAITDAVVNVLSGSGSSFSYSHVGSGTYQSNINFSGQKDENYRVEITLTDGSTILSDWSRMPSRTNIVLLSVDSFEENDENNPGQTRTIFFPRITARDSADFQNYYRWVFYRNGQRLLEPEPITLQDDRFFDGNFIPNLFNDFEYSLGDEMTVELHAINKSTFDFLSLLSSQITTLSASASTTPAVVNGNLNNITNPGETVLGFFGTLAVSAADTTIQIN